MVTRAAAPENRPGESRASHSPLGRKPVPALLLFPDSNGACRSLPAGLAGLVLLAGLGALASPAHAITARFAPEADTYVSSSDPRSNFGLSSSLRVRGSPVRRAYLRFDVQLPAKAVVSAVSLRLHPRADLRQRGFTVSAVQDDAWDERRATYRSAPSVGSRVGSASLSGSGWTIVPLEASAVSAGKNSLAVDGASQSTSSFASRESGDPPQLVVDYRLPPSSLTPPPSFLAPPSPVPGGLALFWSDEFNAPAGTPPDPASWTHQTGGRWSNGEELQCYTTRRENASHDGAGHLQIVARRETFACGDNTNQYTSARINTKGKREFQYGYIEARMKVPPGQGIWPAFWTLGADLDAVGWPASGEIDVLEVIGREPTVAHQTIHGPTAGGGHWQIANHTTGAPWHEDFHTYGVLWLPDRITFFVDGTLKRTLTPSDLAAGWQWAFNKRHFLLLNLAVGGTWPGYPDATTPFPATLLVDYVRAYL
jgi:hypothetical protein